MQALLTAIVAGLALAPLWLPAPGRSGAVARVLLTLAAVAAVVFASLSPTHETPPSPTRPLETPSDGYVGSRACRSCHPEQHATWHESFHRTMTQVASRDALAAKFDTLRLDWFGKPVQLEWRGDTLWATFERGGLQPASVHRPVEQITGSHHLQVLWYSTGKGRELAPVPLCYKIEERIWLPITAAFVLPPEYRDPPEPGAWGQSCHMCHSTNARPRFGAEHNDTHVTELGIACEACHGPGAAHVAANSNPLRRYSHRFAGSDDTIVDPAALHPVRSAQVCGQCHSVSILRQQHAERWADDGLPYRPGQDLHATSLVVDIGDHDAPELTRELRKNPHFFASSFWPDGQVRLSGREFSGLRQSPCYTHGDPNKQMDCSSCHVMHGVAGVGVAAWRDDQLAAAASGNAACTQCHEDLRDDRDLAAHTFHEPKSTGSSCYNCHMGYTTFGLMKAMRSHTITSPSVQQEIATGRPNACNQCHLDRSLQWTAEHLNAKWGIKAPELDEEQRTVAASVRWLLSGDAGQRVLAAWSFGWRDAQLASGTDWQAPYLARLLDDPYYVVRFNAARSLRSLHGGGGELADYDFLAAAPAARAFGERVHTAWASGYRGGPRPAVLLGTDGLQLDAFQRLYARRDDRPVYLAE
ncbi:MAG TPA: cytochrome c3 family protein [Planctomycetota bacterium]|nr:cytochrome c3 family protein [Planctomycetota bacterium]